MKIGNHHVRSSSPYVYKDINGVQYQFIGATYVPKSKIYYLARKAAAGKVALDSNLCGMELQEDNSIRYYVI